MLVVSQFAFGFPLRLAFAPAVNLCVAHQWARKAECRGPFAWFSV
uniref:Uncharacterized protein n=1 Tax=Rhizophora mucronata TaxID=61149 RepID=A0A2P2NKI5_RHIMU